MHLSQHRFSHGLASPRKRARPGSVSGSCFPVGPPSAQSPFAQSTMREALGRRPIRRLVGRYPYVVAHTDSCARPNPSRHPRLDLWFRVSAGCCQPPLGDGPSQRYSASLSPRAWTPTPAAPGVLVPVTFPPGHRPPPQRRTGSALGNVGPTTSGPAATFEAAVIY